MDMAGRGTGGTGTTIEALVLAADVTQDIVSRKKEWRLSGSKWGTPTR